MRLIGTAAICTLIGLLAGLHIHWSAPWVMCAAVLAGYFIIIRRGYCGPCGKPEFDE